MRPVGVHPTASVDSRSTPAALPPVPSPPGRSPSMFFPANRPLLLAAVSTLFGLGAAAEATPQRVGCLWDRHANSLRRFEAGTLPSTASSTASVGSSTRRSMPGSRRAYDPLTDTWSRKADMPSPTTRWPSRARGATCGSSAGSSATTPVSRPTRSDYDVDLDSFTAGPSMPRPIASGGAAVIGRSLHYAAVAKRTATMTGDH